jgi:hypothetical protein
MEQAMNDKKSSKRLTILSTDEIEALYSRPIFTEEERDLYFTLTPPEEAMLTQFGTLTSQMYFILQLGYFKLRHHFFIFNIGEVESDLSYIQSMYFPERRIVFADITRVTRDRHREIIFNLTGYRGCGATEREQIRMKAKQLSRIDSQPIYILRELLAYLTHHRIVIPAYTWLQDTIGDVLLNEQERLISVLKNQLTSHKRNILKALLTNPDGLYDITQLKHEPRSFANTEIAREIKRGEQMKPLYDISHRLIPHLRISNESIKYYASLITYYSVFQMKQRDFSLISVYLLNNRRVPDSLLLG